MITKGTGLREKSKLIAIMIGVLIVALIIASVFFIYERKTERDYHIKQMISDHDEILQSAAKGSYGDFRLATMMLLHSSGVYGVEHCHPTAIGVYSVEGELLWRSGSMIDTFFDGKNDWIDMEEYLTDEKKREMRKWFKLDDPSKTISYIKILRAEGTKEYIPDKLGLGIWSENPNGYQVELFSVIDLSDINGLTEEERASKRELLDHGAVPWFIDDGPGSINHKIYKELYSEITETKEKDKIYLYPEGGTGSVMETENSGSGTVFSRSWGLYHYYWRSSQEVKLNIDGVETPCFVYIASKTNYLYAAFGNPAFKRKLAFIAAGLAIIYAALLIYYGRKKSFDIDEAKRTFVSAAAHELKTPLSVIQNQAECVLEDIAPNKNKEYIASISEEAKRMKEILASLKQYENLSDMKNIEMEELDLADLVEEELEKYRNSFDIRGIDVRCNLEKPAKIKGNSELLKIVIDNYLSNAARYAMKPDVEPELESKSETSNSAKTVLRVESGKEGKGIKFSCFNTHDEIPERELEKAWDMLYKIDRSRTRFEDDSLGEEEVASSDSGGMGLALCKRILDYHGYKYGASNIKLNLEGKEYSGIEFYFKP